MLPYGGKAFCFYRLVFFRRIYIFAEKHSMDVKAHYDNHLAHFYAWMLGDMQERVMEMKQYFQELGISPTAGALTIDLGCGNGVQSLALADLGYRVRAVDFSQVLLDELRKYAKGKKIDVVEADVLDEEIYKNGPVELIVCMGDTLTHLDTEEDVDDLIRNSAAALDAGGKLLLSFREYSALAREAVFIPVRSDAERILTCILQYSDYYVLVHDLLYENKDGQWQQRVSSYRKLRLAPQRVKDMLCKSGLKVIRQDNVRGMIHLLAEKPDQ